MARGIEITLKAINIWIKNVEVCKQGCGALLNMTANGKKKNRLNTTQ